MHHLGFSHFKEWRFAQLSLLIILFMLVSPFFGQSWLFQIFIQLVMLNSLLVTLSATGNRARPRRILWTLWFIAATASLANFLPATSSLIVYGQQVELLCLTLLLGGCVVGILSFAYRNLFASIDGIFAALVAYLLLAFAFAMLFVMLRLANAASFRVPLSVEAYTPHAIRLEMIYFSFVTIATLGYGDIVPVTIAARTLAVIEAVIGQFYVAVVVAMLVGSVIARAQFSDGARK